MTTQADIAKYAALLLKAFNLEQQFTRNPPKDPTAYLADLTQIISLYSEAKAMIDAGVLAPADIAAAHAVNQTQWSDTKPSSFGSSTAPAPAGPSSVEYATMDEAIAASKRTPGYPIVLRIPHGTFIIWPAIAPFPGVQVWGA